MLFRSISRTTAKEHYVDSPQGSRGDLGRKYSRPLHARGIRISYATMPRWALRSIAITAALMLVFVVLVGERVVAARIGTSHHHRELAPFVISIAILVLLAWRLFLTASKARRFGWLTSRDSKSTSNRIS